MSSDWVKCRLNDVIHVKHGFAFKSEFFADEQTSHQLVTPGNFAIGGGFQLGKGKFYSGPVPEEYVLKKGNVVVTMTDLSRGADTLGYAAVVPETTGTTWLHNQRVGLVQIKDFDAVDTGFIHYLLRSPEYRHWVVASATGSTVKHTAPSRICNFEFMLPSIYEQRSISTILGALDDRITLLRETNTTLESIAQAIFKSWFVDFDPVRAKQEGSTPEGMDEATAALFPDGFEESELGLVPKGWKVSTLASLVRLHKGSINPGAHPDAEFQHFSLPAFDAGKMPIFELGCSIKSNKTTVPDNAVLLSKLNPHIPRVWLPSLVEELAVCSTEFLPFLPAGPSTTAFVYCLLAAPDFSAALCQLVTGTSNSHQRVKPDGVLTLPSIVPPREAVSAFDNVASALLARLKANREQAQTLTALRDTLLPRLISGQLRLPEAEALAA